MLPLSLQEGWYLIHGQYAWRDAQESFSGTVQLFFKFLFAIHPFASTFLLLFFLKEQWKERQNECIGECSSAAGSEPPTAAVPVLSLPTLAQCRCVKPYSTRVIVNSASVNCVFAGCLCPPCLPAPWWVKTCPSQLCPLNVCDTQTSVCDGQRGRENSVYQ